MVQVSFLGTATTMFCALLAGGAALGPARAQSEHAPSPQAAPAAAAARNAAAPPLARKSSAQRQVKITAKARNYYVAKWGVDELRVSSTQSGNLIRFSYRVAEPELAKPLGNRGATPYLVAPRSRAVLQVPVMDKIGMLRQANVPEGGKEYWMVFSNKGNLVRPGDRVNVMIGAFRADGLMVE